MPRPRSDQPTEGELEILRVLWQTGPSELGTIRAAILEQRPVATTTVATMLKVMLEKGLVRRKRGDKGWVWTSRVTRKVATRGLVGRLLDGAFDGSARGLISHLIEDGRLDDADREEILRLLGEEEPEA
ncbi:MAG: hypothetical protein CMJ83_05470 [Planctomycetes bacterium]|nr:hypothetical protein [Planctomycetota bacterium]